MSDNPFLHKDLSERVIDFPARSMFTNHSMTASSFNLQYERNNRGHCGLVSLEVIAGRAEIACNKASLLFI